MKNLSTLELNQLAEIIGKIGSDAGSKTGGGEGHIEILGRLMDTAAPRDLISYSVELKQASVVGLFVTPFLITAKELGLGVGQGLVIDQSATIWELDSAGVLFAAAPASKFKLTNGVGLGGEDLAVLTEAEMESDSFAKVKPSIIEQTLVKSTADPAVGGLQVTTSNEITGGGVDAYIKLTFFYRIFDMK